MFIRNLLFCNRFRFPQGRHVGWQSMAGCRVLPRRGEGRVGEGRSCFNIPAENSAAARLPATHGGLTHGSLGRGTGDQVAPPHSERFIKIPALLIYHLWHQITYISHYHYRAFGLIANQGVKIINASGSFRGWGRGGLRLSWLSSCPGVRAFHPLPTSCWPPCG